MAKEGEKLLGLKNGGGAVKAARKKNPSKVLKSIGLGGANLTASGKMRMGMKKGGKVKRRKRRGRVKR